jgi:hypothetical protein
MRRLISLGIGFTVAAVVACSSPEYTPDLTDYIVALGENGVSRSSYSERENIDLFDDYAMVYSFAERLVGKEPSAEGFKSFVATNFGQSRLRTIARKQLKEIEVLSVQHNPPEWVIAVANPESAADSEVICRMTSVVRDGFSFFDCRVVYAEYSLSRFFKNFAHYLDDHHYF